jgi:hypothetical protein
VRKRMQKSHVMRELFCFIAPYIVPYPAGKCQARGGGGWIHGENL